MAEFHFLRPWWLAALPVGVWLIWRAFGALRTKGNWPAVIDARLQPYVLSASSMLKASRWPAIVASLAWLAAVVALAGPAWERLPVPAFRSDEALVVVMDLSRSMDAGDVEPSRLARARLKLLSLLERRQSGQIALVVFSAHAFTVTPLTTDHATVALLVNALSSDIMPSRGSYPEAGLEKAGLLLSQTGLTEGEILLITDADVSSAALDAVRELRGDGYTTHVLAVGTEDGAPIPSPEGGFVTDRSGQVAVPRVDARALAALADAGGGRFATLSADDRDLDRLFPANLADRLGDAAAAGGDEQDYEADVWRDEGIWLTLLLLPLVAFGFRRGWVCGVLVWLAWPAPRADAFEWRDLWQRPDQQGYSAMREQAPERAAALFDDDEWRAAAQYRAGDFPASAQSLSGIDTAASSYNRGNALARAGELEAAIAAYDRAIELSPGHEDAIFNRELVRDLLEQQREQQQQSGQQDASEEAGEQNRQANESQSGEQSEGGEQGEEQGEQQAADAEQSESDGSSDDERQARNDPSQADDETFSDPPDPRDVEPGDEDPTQTAQAPVPAPEDIEQWASEQAADQWLRRIPQDPGGLLRRKFRYQYQRLGIDQDGNYVWPGDEEAPW